jgi:hypothetical protein
MGSKAIGFAKQAGVLAAIKNKVFSPKNLGRAALVGGGAVGGALGMKALKGQQPMAPGALAREKRKTMMDRYGSY